MVVGALLVPALVSFAVKIGVKLAAKAAKTVLDAADSAPVEPAKKSFAALLKDQENRLTAGSGAVTAATAEVFTPADLVGRLAHEQAVRSLALRVQTRLRLPSPPVPRNAETGWAVVAARPAARYHLDASA